MRLEIPYCSRCCWFVPLRCGIILMGYLNLAITGLVISFLLRVYLYNGTGKEWWPFLYRGAIVRTELWVPIVLYSLEIIFNIVLLIGVHKKISRLIRLYYYYGITTALAAVLIAFVVRFQFPYINDWYYIGLKDAFVFAGLVLQTYLLLLIRSELSKPRYREGQLSFVNHSPEDGNPRVFDNERIINPMTNI